MNLIGRSANYLRTVSSWSRIAPWLGYLITLASLAYLFHAVYSFEGALDGHWTERYGNIWFVVSVLLFVASVTWGFLIWRRLLSYEHLEIGTMASANVYLVSQIGKYIPGNVSQYLGRVVLASRRGIPAATTTKLTIIEIAIVIVSAVAFIGVICILQPDLRAQMLNSIEDRLGSVSMLVVIILTVALVIGTFVSFAVAASRARGARTFATMNAFRGAGLLVLGFLCFLALGASFYLLLAKCLKVADPDLYSCIIWITSSWLIGFFTPGAPAGLGVREFVLVTLVAAEYGQSVALESALAFRGVSVVGDLVVLGLGLLAGVLARPASNGLTSESQSGNAE